MSNAKQQGLHVAVLGAGIVGVCTAITLKEAGFAVTLVDPEIPGQQHAASFGNAGWLSPASILPMSMPGLWWKVPGMLIDPLGPLAIRPSALPSLLPWLTRFLCAGLTASRVEATARALRPLIESCVDLHAQLARSAGVPELIRKDGLLYAYVDRQAFEKDGLAWRIRRENGVVWQELENEALRRLEPSLSEQYSFGLFVPSGGHCTAPGEYVAALAKYGFASGINHVSRKATGFRFEQGRLKAVLSEGHEIVCDRAIICSGIHSHTLAEAAGDRPSLAAERGYHVVLPNPDSLLAIPVQTNDSKIGVTPMNGGLRGAGQVELCNAAQAPNWRRAEIILRNLKRSHPKLWQQGRDPKVTYWMGNRPSTPDGLPVIGPASASSDVIHAFGHGHVGLSTGPMTAKIVLAILRGETTSFPLAPYSPQRFNVFGNKSSQRGRTVSHTANLRGTASK